MPELEQVNIKFPTGLLERMDKAMKEQGYVQRTIFIKEAVIEKLSRDETKKDIIRIMKEEFQSEDVKGEVRKMIQESLTELFARR
jgi:metal-responsive CopG/Arc/MetJ family transcriptional regulator